MWTTYSMINSVCKEKYGDTLKKFPRVTSLLKSFDTDVKNKADVFSRIDLDSFVMVMNFPPLTGLCVR